MHGGWRDDNYSIRKWLSDLWFPQAGGSFWAGEKTKETASNNFMHSSKRTKPNNNVQIEDKETTACHNMEPTTRQMKGGPLQGKDEILQGSASTQVAEATSCLSYRRDDNLTHHPDVTSPIMQWPFRLSSTGTSRERDAYNTTWFDFGKVSHSWWLEDALVFFSVMASPRPMTSVRQHSSSSSSASRKLIVMTMTHLGIYYRGRSSFFWRMNESVGRSAPLRETWLEWSWHMKGVLLMLVPTSCSASDYTYGQRSPVTSE